HAPKPTLFSHGARTALTPEKVPQPQPTPENPHPKSPHSKNHHRATQQGCRATGRVGFSLN
ncbi:MAG: hypothetical protein RID07_10985, partial [Lacipirellulaceae bacterium]